MIVTWRCFGHGTINSRTKWFSLRIFEFRYTQLKAEQPLRGKELQEKDKIKKAYRKSVQKEPTVKRCLLVLELKPLRS